jgi:outer membrane protein assembly factor BamB
VFTRSGPIQCFSGCTTRVAKVDGNGALIWHNDYTVGGSDVVRGPGGFLFTVNYSDELVGLDQGSGNQFCQSSIPGIRSPVGSLTGVFASVENRMVRADVNCIVTSIYTSNDPLANLLEVLLVADDRVYLSESQRVGNDIPFPRLLALTTSGEFVWRNGRVNAFGASTRGIRGVVNGGLYVLGLDSSDGNREKLFLLDAQTGAVLDMVETSPYCAACGVAVGGDGTVYINDLNSTKIWKLN